MSEQMLLISETENHAKPNTMTDTPFNKHSLAEHRASMRKWAINSRRKDIDPWAVGMSIMTAVWFRDMDK